MEKIAIIISVLAGIVQLVGYYQYNSGIYKGIIKPNSATWFLWALGSLIAMGSYISISNDWVKNILPIACAIACMATFVFSYFRGELSKPDAFDFFVITLDVSVLFFWIVTGMREEAHVLLQLDLVVSFVPILKQAWVNPKDERVNPWVLWCIAYVLMMVAIWLRFEDWLDFLYPITYFILCAIVAWIVKTRTALTKG